MSDFTPEEIRVLKALASGLLGSGGGRTSGGGSSGGVASDRDLDGRYGDPEIRKDPKLWAGDTMIGLKYSQCSAEYLTMLAEFFEWCVEQDRNKPDARKHKNGKFYWEFSQKDAALARGWARRIATGWRPPAGRASEPERAPAQTQSAFDDEGNFGSESGDDIPF